MAELLHVLGIKGVEPARWLIILGIAYTLATAVAYFIAPPATEPVAPGPAVPNTASPRATNINDILSRNLFGIADTSGQSVTTTTPAVETRLPLELHGVFVAEVPDDSATIVAQKGQPGMLYAIGQLVPGNAELAEVHTEYIVLRRAGGLEVLKFPQSSGQFVAAPQDDGARVFEADNDNPHIVQSSGSAPNDTETVIPDEAPTPVSSAWNFVTDYRQRIGDDPHEALADFGIAPVAEGESSGYRLGNLANSPYLSQTGLQPGDVILSVNGRPVGDISRDSMEIENVLAQGSARLEVQRGTRRFFVTASLK